MIDVTKGIQAQTLSNFSLAKKLGLSITPVLNKIDVSAELADEIDEQVKRVLDLDKGIRVSAKTGFGVTGLLNFIC